MKISKAVKILVGVLTLLVVLIPFVIMPAVMMFMVFGSGFTFLDPQSVPSPYDVEALLPVMMVFYPLMMCYSFGQMGLQVFYVIHEIKNMAMTDTFRILFVIGTFFLPYIAMPIYFIAYLWKDRPQEAQIVRDSLEKSDIIYPK
jgi:hypothetical protein